MEGEYDLQRALKGKHKGGRLENWTTQACGDGNIVLWGNIYDDDRWANGSRIHTSLVKQMHYEDCIVETRNTYYILGKHQPISLKKLVPWNKKDLDLLSSGIV